MRVLVTGATGLVGSNLIPRLVEEGYAVRATLHRREPSLRTPGVEYVAADLTRGDDCGRVVAGVEHVLHCAANTSGAATMAATPMVHVTPNVLMNSQLLEAAYNAGVQKFVWLSSTTGYPVTGDRPTREDEMFDGEPYEKYFFVGWMKRFSEVLCQMYGQRLSRKMCTIVLRPTNIYGPHDDFEFQTSHVIPALIRKVIERWEPLEVWGTGDDLRDAIYVDDMVDAIVLALKNVDAYTAINIGLGRTHSVKEILSAIVELDGFADANVRFDPSKPTMIPVRAVDTTLAKDRLGFQARVDLREGLRRTIDWYRTSRGMPRQGR